MGNEAQTTRKMNRQSRYTKNSYSLDENSMMSRFIEKKSADRSNNIPNLLDNRYQLSKPEGISQQIQKNSPVLKLIQPEGSKDLMPRSASNPQTTLSKKLKQNTRQQNDSILSKLNSRNDQLRKQLIKISAELSSKLSQMKYKQFKRQKQVQGQDKGAHALRKQLQNAYKQIDRYKKILQQLKQKDITQNEQTINDIQGKLITCDFQIKQTQEEIQAIKNIQKNQLKSLKKVEDQSNNVQLKQIKLQIQALRNKLKKYNKVQRKKQHRQKIAQEYMFQLERKCREMNGDYLPDIKSYANKNYNPDPKYQKNKKNDGLNYQPARWQILDVEDELKTLKQKHQEYHIKIQKSLKAKTVLKDATQKIKQKLQNGDKEIQALKYRRDRYLQIVMGNIQFLMHEDESQDFQISQQQLAKGYRIIVKGNDLPQQVFFDDHGLVKQYSKRQLKIVSVNVWYTNKHQISVIQAIYAFGKQCFLGNMTSKITGQMQKQTFQIEQGDYIKNIMGSFNKKGAIQFLAFDSFKGKAKQFGKQIMNGLNFTFGVNRKQKPICISGFSFFDGSYWRINKLILDVAYI